MEAHVFLLRDTWSSDVELEEEHIPFLHDVFFSFEPPQTPFLK